MAEQTRYARGEGGSPPPLPPLKTTPARRRTMAVLVAVAAACGAVWIVLQTFGVVRPFKVPTGAMSPAVSPGDHVYMEGVSYLFSKPRRGDIVVFKVDQIKMMMTQPPGTLYLKRVAGLPGERVRIADGRLYINEQPLILKNKAGEISYVTMTAGRFLAGPDVTITVPDAHYFVLGDASTNSADSRFWGCLPATEIQGQIAFCYWPPSNVGYVK